MSRLPSDAALLRKMIETEGGGMLEVSMGALREARYAGRLGCHVIDGIGRWLDRAGIGSLPERLPNDQDQVVMLYVRDSRAGTAITLALYLASVGRQCDPSDA